MTEDQVPQADEPQIETFDGPVTPAEVGFDVTTMYAAAEARRVRHRRRVDPPIEDEAPGEGCGRAKRGQGDEDRQTEMSAEDRADSLARRVAELEVSRGHDPNAATVEHSRSSPTASRRSSSSS